MNNTQLQIQQLMNNPEQFVKQAGDPPKEMMTLYDYLHGKHVATATQIRIKQGMYKGV